MYDKLPSELKENALFCLWRYEERDGKITKVPYRLNGSCVDSTKKQDFADFRLVTNAVSGYDGIGMGVFGTFCAIDIDHSSARRPIYAGDLRLQKMQLTGGKHHELST